CQSGSVKPDMPRLSTTTSDRMLCIRSCISCVNPAITALTTIIVATPSITLMIEASAIYRVRRYRKQSSSLYMGQSFGYGATPLISPRRHGGTRRGKGEVVELDWVSCCDQKLFD